MPEPQDRVICNQSGTMYPTFLNRLDNHIGPVLHEHNDCLCIHLPIKELQYAV